MRKKISRRRRDVSKPCASGGVRDGSWHTPLSGAQAGVVAFGPTLPGRRSHLQGGCVMGFERRFLRLAVVAACAFAVIVISGSDVQTYPTPLVTLIGPHAAGGPTDTIARIMADGMRPSLSQAEV